MIGKILNADHKSHGVGRTNSDTGCAVVTLLAEFIAHGLQAEFTDPIALSAIVAVFGYPPDTKQTVAAQQRIQRAART